MWLNEVFPLCFEADLDMRMSKRNEISAYTVVNDYSEEDLSKVLYMYGELKNARAMARVIVDNRNQGPIKTSKQLVEILSRLLPKFKEHKVLAQVYQAIRIEVNQEMEVLKEFLMQTPEVLKKGGRLSLISYHSLEDRLVKRFIRDGMFEGVPEKDFYGNVSVPLKKIGGLIIPSEQEIKINNRARSAKLRIAERV